MHVTFVRAFIRRLKNQGAGTYQKYQPSLPGVPFSRYQHKSPDRIVHMIYILVIIYKFGNVRIS